MTVAVDTNILLDLLLPDPKYLETSLSLLTQYGKRHQLIISEVVYGELASQFTNEETLRDFLINTDIRMVNSSWEALWRASRAWQNYTKTRSHLLQCSHCGHTHQLLCEHCQHLVRSRQHIVSDFLIGGHACFHAGSLLTRDRGYYQRYFPDLHIVL